MRLFSMMMVVLAAGCAPSLDGEFQTADQEGRGLRLTPETIILDEQTVADIEVYDDHVIIDPTEGLLIEEGSVIISDQERIFREVVGLERDGDLLVAQTALASLSDVVESGTFSAEVALDERSGLSFYVPPTTIFNEAVWGGAGNATLSTRGGNITVTPNFIFDYDVNGWNTTANAQADVTVAHNLGFDASFAAQWSGGREVMLLNQQRGFWFQVGLLPVFGDVNVRAYVGANYTASGQASFSASHPAGTVTTTRITGWADYNQRWNHGGSMQHYPRHVITHQSTVKLEGDVYLRVEVEAVLYETMAMTTKGTAGLSASYCPSGYNVDAFAKADLDVGVGWFDWSIYQDQFSLVDWRADVAHWGTCW